MIPFNIVNRSHLKMSEGITARMSGPQCGILRWLLVLFCAGVFLTGTFFGDEGAPNPSPSPVHKNLKLNRGKRIREKETEGTEALDRFEADTVIKSKYELNGVPLEVDPD